MNFVLVRTNGCSPFVEFNFPKYQMKHRGFEFKCLTYLVQKYHYVDVDECSLGNSCGDVDHTTCQNTEGGFACVCVTGFSLDNVTQNCEGKLS